MDSNSILTIWGLNPDDFTRVDDPLVDGDEIIAEAWERRKWDLACVVCGGNHYHVHHRYACWARVDGNVLKSEFLLVHRIVYRCADCGKTFTTPIHNVIPNTEMSHGERAAILAELRMGSTFKQVACNHGISSARVINIFDEAYPSIQRKKLPKILLIDEFKFKTRYGKYVCHLVDFETSTTIDLIKSRTKAYLDEYFGGIGEKERESVRLIVTDMYDEYAAIAKRWFPKSHVVVDRFHVVKQLTEAVNKLRTYAMNSCEKGSCLYSFMKRNWKLFLCRKKDVPDCWYTKKSTGETWHYDELIKQSLRLSEEFFTAYHLLQELLAMMRLTATHQEALNNIRHIANQLISTGSELLERIGQTYLKWENGISLAMAKNEYGYVVSNGKIEAGNGVAQTMIDDSYGLSNFERFRKRFLLKRWYGK